MNIKQKIFYPIYFKGVLLHLPTMVTQRILVTGGAGFIGSHLVDALVKDDHHVVIFDNLDPQVHAQHATPPMYLNSNAEFLHHDINNTEVLQNVLQDIDVVYHLAASVGVAQSMYQPRRFY